MKKIITTKIVVLVFCTINCFSQTKPIPTEDTKKFEGKWSYDSTTVDGLKVSNAGDPDTDFIQFKSANCSISQNGVEKSGTWKLTNMKMEITGLMETVVELYVINITDKIIALSDKGKNKIEKEIVIFFSKRD